MSKPKDLTFADALKKFVSATKNSMKYAEICAMMGLRHFAETGDLVYCQSFLDAMPKNFIRRAAFVKWLVQFSPAMLEGGKLVKDKSETANAFNIEAAENIKFWEFAPDEEAVNYSAADAIQAVLNVLDRFEKSKKYSGPADDKAKATVVALRGAVKNLQPAGNVEVAA